MTRAQCRALLAAILYAGDAIVAAIRNIEREKEGRDLLHPDIEESIEHADTFMHETQGK